jgi:hypothetical protein
MKKIIQITLIFLALGFGAKGQNFSREFGKIGLEEIELKVYERDREAEAVVLFDYGKSSFQRVQNSFELVFERTTRIKILSNAGLRWSEVEIPFYREGDIFERVYDIEAYTYNFEDGRMRKVPLDISRVYDETINNEWNVRKFAMPAVKEGSVIEYKYKVSTQYMFNLRDWEFQWTIPVVFSQYEVRMIPFYEYTYILQGATRFDQQRSYVETGINHQFGAINYKVMVHVFAMRNVPAFSSEEFITSRNDYIMKIDFQLAKINYPSGTTVKVLTTWDQMIKEYLKHRNFGRYQKSSEKLASRLIDKGKVAGMNDREKFDYAMNYMKSNFRWNGRNGRFATKSPSNFVKEKTGNCVEINLFTVAMLNSLGIEAYPLLISTRDHGKIKFDYPYTHFFNYVIILVRLGTNVSLLADATELHGQNDRIPPRCINDKGLLVQRGNVRWIGLESLISSRALARLDISFDENLSFNAAIHKSFTEYDALHYRNTYADNIELIEKKLESKNYNAVESSLQILNPYNINEPYILKYEITGIAEFANDKLYINPFLGESLNDNPLKQNQRTYPVDMTYPRQKVFGSTISIPHGFEIEFVPQELKINNDLFDLNYIIQPEEDKVKIYFDYHFKKAVYSPSEYSRLRSYFSEIVRKGNEKIVLAKKTTGET